jgi:hypothetical protein
MLLEHSAAVADKALYIAKLHPEMDIDADFVYEAAMLHDIGIFKTDAPKIFCYGSFPYICHGYLGSEIMTDEGFPRHALVCERHTGTGLSLEEIESTALPLPHRDMRPVSTEEQLICFADKFYSKTRIGQEKTVDKIRYGLTKYGEKSVMQFDKWLKMFLCLLLFLPMVSFGQGVVDSIGDSRLRGNDTDSLGDTIRISSDALDAPVHATAKDSMVMIMENFNKLFLYGEGKVEYKTINLEAEYIEMNADSSIIYSTFGRDTLGAEIGYPVFKDGETEPFEMKEATYNFKTKKMYVKDVITRQGEGFMTAALTKRMPNEDMYIVDGKYTTCDETEHPHWYFNFAKGKLHPGGNTIVGPTFLVIEDVPLPVFIPFGFFPSSSSNYSSGIIMPGYGDEISRGFSLRDGGYYFAINDYLNLELTGEIYTKGSWGAKAVTNYRKRYKYSGSINAGYLVTITGDKDTRYMQNSDYSKSKDIKFSWTHTQDAKANPFWTFGVNFNFSTSSYDRNNLNSIYTSNYSQNTKSSNINLSYRPPNSNLSVNANMSLNQVSRDTTLSVTLPNVSIAYRQFYPFKRKEQVGDERWYEKIYMSYSGNIRNSIESVKEYDFFKKSLIKDWRNGMKHDIPISASFTVLKNINLSPSFNYSESWYTRRVMQAYDPNTKTVHANDTTSGFYRVYNYNASISANTTLYGFYKPLPIFGNWTKNVEIRHVLNPSVSFSGAPDFSDPQFGMYTLAKYYDDKGVLQSKKYSPYENQIFGAPSQGKSGSLSFSLENNVEAKIRTDTVKKVSLIDNLGLSMSYNFLADSLNWSNMNANLRLKIFGKTISVSGQFDTYMYDENGRHINVTRWKGAKGFGKIGRFMGTSTSYPLSLNNEAIKNWFKKKEKSDEDKPPMGSENQEGIDPENQIGVTGVEKPRESLRSKKKDNGDYDDDGYLLLNIPWNLNFNYTIGFNYDMSRFDREKREYPYRISQGLSVSGNISPTKGWSFNFSTSYDFEYKKFAIMQCSLTRQMHCWNMSASFIPIGPYQSYSFTIQVNAEMLKDLKYQQSSNSRDAVSWGNR